MSEVFDVILGGLDTEVDVSIADSTGVDPSVLLALRGEKGDKGDTGAPGASGYTPIKGVDYFDGQDGADGYTPVKGVDYFDGQDGQDGADGYTPIKGVDYFDGQDGYTPIKGVDYFDGQDGKDGEDGADGYTPIKGVDYFDGKDGKDGKDGEDGYTPIKGVDYFDGEDGTDGFSPTATVTKVGDTATISITDENGTTTATITDGTDGTNGTNGKDGDDGVGIASIDKTATVGLVDTYTITYTDGTTTTYQVTNGQNGSGSVADVWVNGTSVLDDDVAKIDLTGKADVSDIPTSLSELSNDVGYITGYTETDPIFVASAAHGISSSDISNWNGKSDFSGSYNDLTDKPTIPTVNNATLTIQKNGTNVQTFTANASSNKTANITVPTKVSDLTNDSGFITGYTETDPIFTASPAYGISASDITSWDGKSDFSGDYDDLSNKPTLFSGDYNDLSNKPTIPTVPTNVSAFTNDAGYLTSFTETDPVFIASAAAGISSTDISNWGDGLLDFDTTAASGDDYDLTQALTDLGWLSDVIV